MKAGRATQRPAVRVGTLAALAVLACAWGLAVRRHEGVAAIVALVGGLGVVDSVQRRSALRRNFPVVGRALELVAVPSSPFAPLWRILAPRAPFAAPVWELVRRRADGQSDLASFGSIGPIGGGALLRHSMAPLEPRDVERRIRFGGPRTRAPYEAALLNISALSFGAISESALRALSTGAKEAGCYCNSGEGGLHPALLDGGGDLVWQVGSAYFGCRRADGRFDADRFAATAGLPAVKMIELKLSQGAKPGHGGVLPAHKVTLAVAQACGIQPYHDSLCPARHAEFQTPAEMLAFIDRLRALSGGKPVGVKLAVGHPAEVVALVRAMFETDLAPDYVAIDGGEGGSGAAPAEFIGRLALPLLDALWVIHNVLRAAGLRDRVQVVGSGQIAMGSDMVRAFALGADVCAAARAFMLALGCIQAMACQTDRCPTGIATQNRYLSGGLVSETKAFAVARYQSATVESCTGLMAAMGRSHPRRLGPADLYDPRDESECCLFEAEGAFLRGEARSRGLQAAWESSRV